MNQKQTGGDHSTNIQANSIINLGISTSEARQIALDVYRANLIEMQGIAHRVAEDRLKGFTEDFLGLIQKTAPEALSAMHDPDIQYNLYSAGLQYARSGEETLGKTLADLLVKRCTTSASTLRAVVLNEAIGTIGRLTRRQIITLTMNWLVGRVNYLGLKTIDDLRIQMEYNVLPFLKETSRVDADYDHLAYTGCAGLEVTEGTLTHALQQNYPGLFPAGINPGQIDQELSPHKEKLFDNFPEREGYLQVRAVRSDDIKALVEDAGCPELKDKIEHLLKGSIASGGAVKDAISGWSMEFSELIDLWEKTPIKNLRITSVGTAIAHSYWARATGSQTPLSIWIPDD